MTKSDVFIRIVAVQLKALWDSIPEVIALNPELGIKPVSPDHMARALDGSSFHFGGVTLAFIYSGETGVVKDDHRKAAGVLKNRWHRFFPPSTSTRYTVDPSEVSGHTWPVTSSLTLQVVQ